MVSNIDDRYAIPYFLWKDPKNFFIDHCFSPLKNFCDRCNRVTVTQKMLLTAK